MGTGGPDVQQDEVVLGRPIQELYTSFPLGSSVVTGFFVEIDAIDSTGRSTPTRVRSSIARGRRPPGFAPVNVSLPARRARR